MGVHVHVHTVLCNGLGGLGAAVCVWGWACGCQACVYTCASLVQAHVLVGCCVKGRGSEISGGWTPGWGSGSRRGFCCV